MSIKGVLREELKNSERMKVQHEKELAELPVGSLVKKKVKRYEYYYLVYRENGRVEQDYMGKNVSKDLLEKYRRAKKLRAQYRKQLSQIKKQIKFLKGALRGQESI